MAREFKLHERAPHIPNRCVVTGVTGKPDNLLIDLDTQIDYYGMVYLSYNVFVAIADQLGFATPEVANALRTENTTLKERLDRIPAVTERLVNDIRDISITATAELLTDSAPIVLANDEKPEQSNTGANLDYFGDGNASEPDSESSGSEGSASVPAGDGSKRKSTSSTRPSSTNN
jgi:hypothetical protein